MERDTELEDLRAQVAQLEAEKTDLENMLDTASEHADLVEEELDKKNLLLKGIFGRYITKEVVTELLGRPDGLKLGGQRRRITMLTSDLRGFTSFSERLEAEQVIQIINHYLSTMADVITSFQGTIDEFMGDGILVFFGAPTAREDDAPRAVACAVAMQHAMGRVNEQVVEWGFPALEMGIGINTGEVVVGNIGSEKRAKYGVVGSQVNLTYRVESFTLGGQVLISDATLQQAGPVVQVGRQFHVHPKGVAQPLTIHDVVGVGAPYNLQLLAGADVPAPTPAPVPVRLAVLEGKHQSEETHAVQVVALSARTARLAAPAELVRTLAPLTNVTLLLDGLELPPALPTVLYAKVVETDPEVGVLHLRFTSATAGVFEHLRSWASRRH